jgi:hypothetical protein
MWILSAVPRPNSAALAAEVIHVDQMITWMSYNHIDSEAHNLMKMMLVLPIQRYIHSVYPL